MKIPNEKLMNMYKKLIACRKVDDKLLELNTTGVFSGWLHLGAGQEAMPVAVGAAVREGDYMKPDYRGAHCAVARGVPLRSIFGTLMAKRTERPEGDWWAPEYGLLGISSSLGEDIPIYVGVALAQKQLGTSRVTVCVFGDGTSNRGPVHEGMNWAAAWKLPIVFICVNNQYAVSTSVRQSFAGENIADRAVGYGMPGSVVDGNDVIACYEEVSKALDRARSGGGPSFIEAKTYRLRGHWEGDPQNYRKKEDVKEARKKEPIPRFQKTLMKMGLLSGEDLERIDIEVTAEIDEAVKYAESLPPLGFEEVAATVHV